MKQIAPIASAIGIILLVVAAVVLLSRAQQVKSTIAGLKDQVETWKGNADAEKSRGDRLEAEVGRLMERVDKLERDNAILSELAHGVPEIRELRALLVDAVNARSEADTRMHEENLGSITRLEGGISRIETYLLNRKDSL